VSVRPSVLAEKGVEVMQPVSESIVFTAIRQCLETADHYGRQPIDATQNSISIRQTPMQPAHFLPPSG
jgi:hypothetical protein